MSAINAKYYAYVNSCRAEAKRLRKHIVQYKTFAQWRAADIDTRSPAVRDMDALLNSVADEQCDQAKGWYDAEPVEYCEPALM